RRAGFQPVDDFGRFGLEAFRDLILAPFLLDARTHLIEIAFARRLDARDLEPDVAAPSQLDRLILDARVGAKRVSEHVDAGWQAGDLLAFWVATLTVDRLDRARGQIEFLRHLGQTQAGGALVLDLVVARGELAPGTVGCDRLL